MGQNNDTSKNLKWKQLSERERYKIETLLKEKLTAQEIAKRTGRNRRTIERKIARGSVAQRDSGLREHMVYLADVGQRIHAERGANKGRGLKIANDHKLVKHIKQKIGKEKCSPDAVIGEIHARACCHYANGHLFGRLSAILRCILLTCL